MGTQSRYIPPEYAVTTFASFEEAQEMRCKLKVMADTVRIRTRTIRKQLRLQALKQNVENLRSSNVEPMREKPGQAINAKRKVTSNARLPERKILRKHPQNSQKSEKRHPLTYISWPLQPTAPAEGPLTSWKPPSVPAHLPQSQQPVCQTTPSPPLQILPHLTILKPSLAPHSAVVNGDLLIQQICDLLD